MRFTGCVAVLSGPRCVLPPHHRLRITLEEPAAVSVRVDEVVLTSTAGAGGGFVRAISTTELEVRVPDAPSRRLSIRDAETGRELFGLELALAGAESIISELESMPLADAELRAEKMLPDLAAGPRSAIHAWLAQKANMRGDREAALVHTRRRIETARLAGRISDVVRATAFYAFTARQLSRFREAKEALAALPNDLVDTWPEGQAIRKFHEGALASELGDVRAALASFSAARALSVDERLRRNISEDSALAWLRAGRIDRAVVVLKKLRAELSAPADTCARANAGINLAWAALLAAERKEPIADLDVRALLEESRASLERDCGAAADAVANVIVNQSLEALHAGNAAKAERLLEEAKKKPLWPEVQAWVLEIERRLALGRGETEAALRAADQLAAHAEITDMSSFLWLAAVGKGEALERKGDLENAARVYRSAETIASLHSAGVPVDQGLMQFVADHDRSARRLVAVLAALGRPADALEAARRARRRVIENIARLSRHAAFGAEDHEKYLTAATEFRERRRAVEALRVEMRPMRGASLEAARRRLDELERDTRALLDRSSIALGNGPADTGALHALDPDELLLLWMRAEHGFIAIAARSTDPPWVKELDEPPEKRDATAYGAWLLQPFAAELDRARRVYLLPPAELAGIDVHALLFISPRSGKRERLLAEGRSVVYGLDLPNPPPLAKTARAAVIIDPTGSLEGARSEGVFISKRLGQWGLEPEIFEFPKADYEHVISAIERVDWLHYAGHSVYAGEEGWDSRLLLSRDTTLSLGDVLLRPKVPAHVVLSSCEAAASAQQPTLAQGIGLAHAFVLAGSREVLASIDEVPDEATFEAMRHLYERIGRENTTLESALLALAARGSNPRPPRLVVP